MAKYGSNFNHVLLGELEAEAVVAQKQFVTRPQKLALATVLLASMLAVGAVVFGSAANQEAVEVASQANAVISGSTCVSKFLNSHHPTTDTSPKTNAGAKAPCTNNNANRAACRTYCEGLVGCNGFWYYNNGRCCPKATWSSTFYREIPNGGFYEMTCTPPPCPAGQYRAAGAATCSSCTAGKYTDREGLSSCSTCPDGKYSAAGADGCTECAAGKAGPSAGAAACTDCAAGSYSAAGATDCTDCAAGKIAAAAAAASCTDCAVGKSSSGGAAACFDCAGGSYNDVVGSDSCTPCAPGTKSDGGDATCTACAAGKFADGDGSTTCTNCPAGKISVAGAYACTDCGAGTYCAAGATTCTNCAAGTSNSRTGQAACATCTAGKSSAAGASSCTACAIGQTSTAGAACANCGDGKYTDSAGMAPCASCSTGIVVGAPSATGMPGTSIISTWALNDRVWGDRVYWWNDLNDYTPANYDYKVKTSVTHRNSGMDISLDANYSPLCYRVVLVSEAKASLAAATNSGPVDARLNPGPPTTGSEWSSSCTHTDFPNFKIRSNLPVYGYNYCRQTTLCAGETVSTSASGGFAGKYEIYFAKILPSTC